MRMPKDQTSDLMLNVPKLIASGAVHLIGNFAPNYYTKINNYTCIYFWCMWVQVCLCGGKEERKLFSKVKIRSQKKVMHTKSECEGFAFLDLRFNFPTHYYSMYMLTSFASNCRIVTLVINHCNCDFYSTFHIKVYYSVTNMNMKTNRKPCSYKSTYQCILWV